MSNVTTKVFPTKQEAVSLVADQIETLIRDRAAAGKKAILGLATGSTPVALYQELIRRHKEKGLSFKNVVSFNLDEYYGLPGTHDQSYRYFMNQQLFDHVDINKADTHVPNGTVAEDKVDAECVAYEAAIKAAGGIDIQILGIGRTGHIGFNEPPAGPATRTRKVHLDELTRKDNSVFFGDISKVPHYAITMGVGTILDAHRVVLLAWGEAKADIIRRTLKDTPSDSCPASWLQQHKDCLFVLDQAAAAKI
ncbi:MAG: glucosamine-6-phosphate deaminase [Puniceicoccales bacterium]|jgi:glucosamine-6-phosphate deaminase|nr:glucosamine-6-phosphate deaminase [Puniceicoccales bacterium]